MPLDVPAHEEPAIVRFQAVKELSDAADDVVLDYAPLGTTSTGEKRAFLRRTERRSHSRSTTIHPALCRVAAYRSPGLPSPTTSQGSATP